MSSDTEQQILNAAKKVFTKKGFAGARMQEIADEAGINKAMLHYYFRTKDALFERIMLISVDTVSPVFLASISGSGSVMEKLDRLADSYIDVILQNPHIPMFILHELSQDENRFVDRLKKRMNENDTFLNFVSQVIQEQENGRLKPIPPHHLIMSAVSLIVFPFIAKPIFRKMLDLDAGLYNQMMLERKALLRDFFRAAFEK